MTSSEINNLPLEIIKKYQVLDFKLMSVQHEIWRLFPFQTKKKQELEQKEIDIISEIEEITGFKIG